MKYRVIILPRAEVDEAEMFSYLASHSLAVAARFFDRVDETLQLVSSRASPGMLFVSPNSRLSDFRWTKVRDFPNHLIFFRVVGDELHVVRILHGARDIESILGE